MAFGACQLQRAIGFYVATHPWLLSAGYVKVGCTSSLETRLNMASFTTCFTPQWTYAVTFECPTFHDAYILEQSVLYALRKYRVPHRELIEMDATRVAQVAAAILNSFPFTAECRVQPVYSPVLSADGSTLHLVESGSSTKSDHREGHESLSHSVARGSVRRGGAAPTIAPAERSACAPEPSPMLTDDVVPDATIAVCVATLDRVAAAVLRGNEAEKSSAALDGTSPAPLATDPGVVELGIPMATSTAERTASELLFGPPDTTCRMPDGSPRTTAADGDSEDERGLGDVWNLAPGAEAISWMAAPREAEAPAYRLDGLRDYQEVAVQRCMKELRMSGKAICQMACRCGKTPVAFTILEAYLLEDGGGKAGLAASSAAVLYLVPGLELLRQTACKLDAYGLDGVDLVLVGSDQRYLSLPRSGLSVVMTTDTAQLRARIASRGRRPLVVLSTYHSSPLVATLTEFRLTVFDECHRICGSAEPTNFNHVLLSRPTGDRLFMTATPTYDTPITMDNRHLFGSTAYRYYLREGIDAGYVNPFSVRIVLGESLDDMSPLLLEALKLANKMLVFCRDIQHAESLAEQLRLAHLPHGVAPFRVIVAHSRMGSPAVGSALHAFSAEGQRCVLFNVRLFQEGVEIRDLEAVFFAAPRYSPRDIVQSICRPLNRMAGKPPSLVFLPAVLDQRYCESHPVNLAHFATLIPFTDALMDEDPQLFEYLIDPSKKAYDIDVLGVRALRLSSERVQQFVLPSIRRGVRYTTRNTDRLHRAARLPWALLFTEMKRIVLQCNRYPKTNDAWVVGDTSISMNLFYQYARRGYLQHLRGQHTYLQSHQLRDLESLPEWQRYGVNGPYPFDEGLKTLQTHLRHHRTVPPLDVHKGGYVGLDATPFERLSGVLMHINQCDAHSSVRLLPEKQETLDRMCAEFGIQWRKRRKADGSLASNAASFITRSFEQFKYLYTHRERYPWFQRYLDVHYPGYPTKHESMEDPRNLARGCVPPRHQSLKRRGARESSSVVDTAAAAAACTSSDIPLQAVPPRRSDVARPLRRTLRVARRQSHTAGEPVKTAAPLSTTRLTNREAEKDEECRTVMCRVCRAHIPITQWAAHVASSEHHACLSHPRRVTKSRRSKPQRATAPPSLDSPHRNNRYMPTEALHP